MSMCLTCDGEGTIITCCDDICVGGGHCIHGDGEEICPDCEGEGFFYDDDDDLYIPPEERINYRCCQTCGGEYGPGWSNCICEEDFAPQNAAQQANGADAESKALLTVEKSLS